jgi:Ca2+-binding RTX toxin-like protein
MAVILGTPSSDLLFGTDVNDLVRGFEGDDLGYGLAGDDVIQGNPGEDTLLGNLGNDTTYGGFSDDLLYGGKGNDVLFGDRGDDTLIGNRGADFIQGGAGKDTYVIGRTSGGGSFQGADTIADFRNGEDIIALEDGLNFRDLNINAGVADNIGNTIIEDNFTGAILAILQGVNRASIGPDNFTTFVPSFNPGLPSVSIVATDPTASEGPIVGDNGVFTVTRTNTVGNLTVNYIISGTAQNGTDYLNIPNAVTIVEGQSSATITIAAFDDKLAEPSETVILDLSPSAAYNVVSPNTAQVTIVDLGGPTRGPDNLIGTSAADIIDGLGGNDTIDGAGGNDSLVGNDDNDLLIGGEGDDTLIGSAGNDLLVGSVGADSLTGDTGVDAFSFGAPTEGGDTITDFVVSETIIISAAGFGGGLVAGTLPAIAFEAAAAPTTADVRFLYDAGDLLFDPDGNATAGDEVLIATLTGTPAITATNILIV